MSTGQMADELCVGSGFAKVQAHGKKRRNYGLIKDQKIWTSYAGERAMLGGA